jgi:hypothetical protein
MRWGEPEAAVFEYCILYFVFKSISNLNYPRLAGWFTTPALVATEPTLSEDGSASDMATIVPNDHIVDDGGALKPALQPTSVFKDRE